MKYFLIVLFAVPSFVTAQTQLRNGTVLPEKGIRFVSDMSWKEIQAKAKAEKKMIFLDCYTTWCGPCKIMDKQVYPLEDVGVFFNRNFICVKVQMDKTKSDNEQVKSWYKDAKFIEKNYSISAFPTYLFLSSDAQPLHRAVGAYQPNKFLEMASNALDPETQSYTIARRYDISRMDTAALKAVAVKIRRTAPEFAAQMALTFFRKLKGSEIKERENIELLLLFSNNSAVADFARGYLNSLDDNSLATEAHIRLLLAFLKGTEDKGFWFLYKNNSLVDSIMNHGRPFKSFFVKSFVDDIITNTEVSEKISDAFSDGREPDWNGFVKSISTKFDRDVAERIVLKAKMSWYAKKRMWELYCQYIVQYMDLYNNELEFEYTRNKYAWLVFSYSNDKSKLEKALLWSNQAIQFNPTSASVDTYANILYKLGYTTSAIVWEEIALNLAPDDAELKETLGKMKNGVPTWPLH